MTDRRRINAELASIERLQNVRQFFIAQAVVLIASASFGVSSFFARLVYDRIYPPAGVDSALLAMMSMNGTAGM